MHYLTRLSFNTSGWRHPTGAAREQETGETYNQLHGFGHEDWLFRTEWSIDGWRYAFLQGVNKSHDRLVREAEPFDVTLFTIEPDKTRRYVATLRDVECLDERQADDALRVFKANGWYDTMLEEIGAVGGNPAALGSWDWARHLLNVRFRQEQVERRNRPGEPLPGAWINRRSRYQLIDFDRARLKESAALLRGRSAAAHPPSTEEYPHEATPGGMCTPEHARMQVKLFETLKQEHPDAAVECERDFIDVRVETAERIILYEIKSDLRPLTVIRNALGQILEYAFHPSRSHGKPVDLVIVGRQPLDPLEAKYLKSLVERFSLPLAYRAIPI